MKPAIRNAMGVLCSLLFLQSLMDTRAAVSERAVLPNFDKRQTARVSTVSPNVTSAEVRLHSLIPDARIQRDELLGSPAWITSVRGFLTGTNGAGRGTSAAAATQFSANDPHRATKAFLQEHRALFGHGPEALVAARVKRDYVTAHNGLHTVVWEQQVDGIPIFEGLLISHTTKNGELVSIGSYFVPYPVQAANAGTPNRRALQSVPPITAQEALVRAAGNLGEYLSSQQIAIASAPAADDAERHYRFTSPSLSGESYVNLVWLPMKADSLKLCWEVILMSRARGAMFRVLIDALTGESLLRHCLTDDISDATFRVYTSDSPTPMSPGFATPVSTQPALDTRVLITTNAYNTNASPNGWIDDGVNETRGNNVDAYTDHSGSNTPDLPRPQGNPYRVFDFPLDLTQDPLSYTNAAVSQAFFLANVYHDRLYDFGFTEAAGNFQVNNFGRGGLDNDPVDVQCQDGSGTDNANFSTPPDGASGRMRLYLFTGPNPRRDGSLDAEVVFHEDTHGLSNRRVGGGVGITALQSRGLGEGWSDFYALCMLSDPSDDVNGNYAFGAYVAYQFAGLNQNYYYGIRHYPYTTDMTKDPFTFKDIDSAQVIPHTGVPVSPVFPFNPSEANEVHHQGEVWCAALWDARANLINKYGAAAGNHLMMQLVTDGLGLTPANPNFLQARDAIIQADQVDTGGANSDDLWAAFAKRGLGFFASSPDSSTTAGVVESFALPDDLSVSPQTGFSATGPVGGPFSTSSVDFALSDVGTNPVSWVAVPTVVWLNVSQTNNTLSPTGLPETVTVSLGSKAAALPAGIYAGAVQFTNLNSGTAQTRQFTLLIGQPDYFTEYFQASDNDLHYMSLTFTPDGSQSFYSVCRQPATNFPADPTGGTVVSLTDDSYVEVDLPPGTNVSIYGQAGNVFYIGSNGYLTFGSGDINYAPSLDAHFNRPRISPMFVDLNPGMAGTVSWKQLPDRVTVTYVNVPEYALANSNNFQVEMFFDGRIRITYLEVDALNGLAGLSAGNGTPAGFVESDLDAYSVCPTPNQAPVLGAIADSTIDELTLLAVTCAATDADIPTNTLTFTLDPGAPAGAGIDPASGQFSWTPTEAQGPGVYSITVRVTDNGAPPLSDAKTFSVTVNEANSAPILSAITNQTIDENTLLSFTCAATDSDIPANTLTFSLDPGAPAGVSIDASSGQFSWTPTEAQGPGVYSITVRVTDNGVPPLSNTNTFTVTVNEVNSPPVLAAIPDTSIDAGTALVFTNTAVDTDLPANTLTYSLDPGAPDGASVGLSNGVFSWTPTLAQASGAYNITVRVTDDGIPPLSDARTFNVAVLDVIRFGIGETVVNAGDSGVVPLTLFSSASLTNLSFTLSLPAGDFTNLQVNAAPPKGGSVLTITPALSQVTLTNFSGQSLLVTQQLAGLQVTACSNLHSAFVPLAPLGVSATRLDGTPIFNVSATAGRVVILGPEPLLETRGVSGGSFLLTLYGHTNATYAIQSTADLATPGGWANLLSVLLTNSVQDITGIPGTNDKMFFRAVTQ